jgi:thiamine biosynthesis lipoprotein
MPADEAADVLGDLVLGRAENEIARRERRWSRFLPDSELSRLNAATGGRPVLVSAETFAVIQLAVDAWRTTAGRFDPTVLDALVAAGYDRTFDDIKAAAGDDLSGADTGPPPPVPGCAAIELDPGLGTVTLPVGVHLDLGGVGKGRAADLVAERMLADGADGACVNLGGDVRVAGLAPDDDGWVVAIDDPFRPDVELTRVALVDGAVTTSARTNRHWRVADADAHHLIDPSTGRPAGGGLAAVTVLAADASWAEILSKATFVAGADEGPALLAGSGACGVLVHDDGSLTRVGGFERFEP